MVPKQRGGGKLYLGDSEPRVGGVEVVDLLNGELRSADFSFGRGSLIGFSGEKRLVFVCRRTTFLSP